MRFDMPVVQVTTWRPRKKATESAYQQRQQTIQQKSRLVVGCVAVCMDYVWTMTPRTLYHDNFTVVMTWMPSSRPTKQRLLRVRCFMRAELLLFYHNNMIVYEISGWSLAVVAPATTCMTGTLCSSCPFSP